MLKKETYLICQVGFSARQKARYTWPQISKSCLHLQHLDIARNLYDTAASYINYKCHRFWSLKVTLLALFGFRRDMIIKMQAREPSDSILPPPSFTP